MRGLSLSRLYVAVSCLVFGIFLAASAALAAACWLVPEWAQGIRLEMCRGIIPDPAPGGDDGGTPAPVPEEAPAPPAAESARDPEPRASREAARDASRLVSALGESRQKLAAWEALRKPLLSFLSSVRFEGVEDPPIDENADIRAISRAIGRKIELLSEPARPEEPGLVPRIDPRTLARILVEDGTLQDEDSVRCMEALDETQRTELLDRLSRLSPRRAAGILQKMLHPGNREEGSAPFESTHGKAFVDHGKFAD